MQNISFNDGYNEYRINNDETKVIRFNPSDFNIIERASTAMKTIPAIVEEMEKEDFALNPDGTVNVDEVQDIELAGKMVSKIDRGIKEQIDFIMGNNVCDIVFEGQSCLSLTDGVPLYERFLDAVIPIIKKDVENEQKASQKRIDKHTKAVKV